MMSFLLISLRVALVILTMTGMVVILLGISHFLRTDDCADQKDTDLLRHEVDRHREVISRHSVFHNFLVRTRSENPTRR